MPAETDESIIQSHVKPRALEAGFYALMKRLWRKISEPIIELCIRLSGLIVDRTGSISQRQLGPIKMTHLRDIIGQLLAKSS